MDSDISESEAESFEGKFIKNKKGKGTGKQTQGKKNINKQGNKDINQILINSDEEVEENKNDDGKDKEGEEMPIVGNNEDLNNQGQQKEDQEDKRGKSRDCVGENESIKGFYDTVNTMVKDIGGLKKDMNVIKRATIGDKPLTENVKELAVAINNVEAIESMASKIIAIENKVKEMAGNKEVKGMEIAMNNLGSKIDIMELTIKKIAEQNFQILKASVDNMNILINRFDNNKEKEGDKDQLDKKGHEKRTRANTRNKGDIKGRELDDLKTSADDMKQMVVHVEDIMKNI